MYIPVPIDVEHGCRRHIWTKTSRVTRSKFRVGAPGYEYGLRLRCNLSVQKRKRKSMYVNVLYHVSVLIPHVQYSTGTVLVPLCTGPVYRNHECMLMFTMARCPHRSSLIALATGTGYRVHKKHFCVFVLVFYEYYRYSSLPSDSVSDSLPLLSIMMIKSSDLVWALAPADRSRV